MSFCLTPVQWWEESVGPGCVEGNLVYPGIPGYVTCPDPEEAETTLITNWDDCASYFRCYELTPVLECCPKGLLYDPPMRVCDDPPHVSTAGQGRGVCCGCGCGCVLG